MFDIALEESWPDLKNYYQENGYVVIDTGLPESLISSLAADLSDWFEKMALPSDDVSMFGKNRLQDGWRIDERIKEIAINEKINQLLAFLYNKQPKPFQTLNFQFGTQQPTHSDAIHFNSEPFGMMCGVWLALENIGPKQGPLVFYPGSNLLPDLDYSDLGLQPKGTDFIEYSAAIQQVIEEYKFEPKYGVLEKGQAIIWASNLLHGGSRRLSDQTRLSQVTHYYFEDCKYWRPSMSYDTRHYFEPNWIDISSHIDTHKITNLLQRSKSGLKKMVRKS